FHVGDIGKSANDFILIQKVNCKPVFNFSSATSNPLLASTLLIIGCARKSDALTLRKNRCLGLRPYIRRGSAYCLTPILSSLQLISGNVDAVIRRYKTNEI